MWHVEELKEGKEEGMGEGEGERKREREGERELERDAYDRSSIISVSCIIIARTCTHNKSPTKPDQSHSVKWREKPK